MAKPGTGIYIDITSKPQQIGISRDNVNFDWINKKDLSVIQGFNPNPNSPKNYRYPTRCTITLKDTSGNTQMEFECQDVLNQSSWSGGTQSDLNQAASDLADWIATP